ncbi:MAG: hypothetical protein V8S72_01135 [Oscillospiraceae bacterium]
MCFRCARPAASVIFHIRQRRACQRAKVLLFERMADQPLPVAVKPVFRTDAVQGYAAAARA